MRQTGEDRQEPGLSDALIDYDRVANVYDLYVTSDLDIGFYVEEAAKVRGKVIELMCGTGRVSIPLLEAGVDLTCVDASEGMLERLQERLRARDLEARVVQADVRHLERFAMSLVHEPSWGDGCLFGRSQKEDSRGRPGAPHEPERGCSCFRG